MLDAEYLTAAEQRARRFQGAWTGTSGTLAADVMHLLNERQTMSTTIAELEAANQNLRDAVASRLNGEDQADNPTAIADAGEDAIPSDWILQGERELQSEAAEPRLTGDGVMNADSESADTPAEQLLRKAIDVVRDRRPKYGGPREHFRRTVGMLNAAFGPILKRPLTESDWALIMTLDKVARFLGPTKTSDQITDLAGYAACLAECEA